MQPQRVDIEILAVVEDEESERDWVEETDVAEDEEMENKVDEVATDIKGKRKVENDDGGDNWKEEMTVLAKELQDDLACACIVGGA